MAWVYAVPVWLVCFFFIGGSSTLAAAGLVLVRRRKRKADVAASNDFAGPVMATLGTILAVMLSFMVVTVWQEYDQAAAIVQTEANQIANLYNEVAVFPAPLHDKLRTAISSYVDTVVDQEWPLMRRGLASPRARQEAAAIVTMVEMYSPTTPAQQNAQADALHHAHGFLDARSDRLFQNQQAVPPLLWVVMIFLAVITLCSAYFFAVPSARAHLAMTIALGAVIGAIFVVIAELDLPFRGDLQIAPTAFAQDYATFASDPPAAPKH